MLGQFVRFGVVGIFGFAVDAGVLTLLTVLGLDPYSARLLSFLGAATFTWGANRSLTFRDADRSKPGREWARFVAANSVGGLVNLAVFYALISFSVFMARHPVAAVAAGSIAGLGFNFASSRFFVFRPRPAAGDPPSQDGDAEGIAFQSRK